MIKKVILVGNAQNFIKYWEGGTSKRKRFFLGPKRERGNPLKARVDITVGHKEEEKEFEFVFAETVAGAISLAEKAKKEIKKEEIVLILACNEKGLEEVLCERTSGRYHCTHYGWAVLFERKIKEKDIIEFAGRFFNENLLYSNKDYDDIDEAMWHAKKRYDTFNEKQRLRSFYSTG